MMRTWWWLAAALAVTVGMLSLATGLVRTEAGRAAAVVPERPTAAPTNSSPTATISELTTTGPPARGTAEVTTTTVPPTTAAVTATTAVDQAPYYKLRTAGPGAGVGEGLPIRFNPCDEPIAISFNPGPLTASIVSFLDELLKEQAAELTQMLGFDVIYSGITDDVPQDRDQSSEFVLILVPDDPDDYFLQAEVESWLIDIFGRITYGFVELDAFTTVLSAGVFSESAPLRQRGSMLRTLGLAFGLDDHDESELPDVGRAISSPMGPHGTDWGPGDRAGFTAIGAEAGCF